MSTNRLKRRDVVARLLEERKDLLVISGLGGTTWDAAAVGDHDNNFYLWGGMGLAVSTGLGLALARPERRVLVLTGDGEMLMGLGSLATVAQCAPNNLAIVVIDNERYGETGEQATHTAGPTDLVAVARGAGIAVTCLVKDEQGVTGLVGQLQHATGPIFAVVKVLPGSPPMVLPPRDGVAIKLRFQQAVAAFGADK